jgi:hypothetical protein
MAYFADLSHYAYGRRSHLGVVHVGWLDNIHPFPQGPVDLRLLEKMKLLAAKPVELYRGKHLCDLCSEPPDLVQTTIPNRVVLDPDCSWARWASERSGNGRLGYPMEALRLPRRFSSFITSKRTGICRPPNF